MSKKIFSWRTSPLFHMSSSFKDKVTFFESLRIVTLEWFLPSTALLLPLMKITLLSEALSKASNSRFYVLILLRSPTLPTMVFCVTEEKDVRKNLVSQKQRLLRH